jgi:hypothetical protein
MRVGAGGTNAQLSKIIFPKRHRYPEKRTDVGQGIGSGIHPQEDLGAILTVIAHPIGRGRMAGVVGLSLAGFPERCESEHSEERVSLG